MRYLDDYRAARAQHCTCLAENFKWFGEVFERMEQSGHIKTSCRHICWQSIHLVPETLESRAHRCLQLHSGNRFCRWVDYVHKSTRTTTDVHNIFPCEILLKLCSSAHVVSIVRFQCAATIIGSPICTLFHCFVVRDIDMVGAVEKYYARTRVSQNTDVIAIPNPRGKKFNGTLSNEIQLEKNLLRPTTCGHGGIIYLSSLYLFDVEWGSSERNLFRNYYSLCHTDALLPKMIQPRCPHVFSFPGKGERLGLEPCNE